MADTISQIKLPDNKVYDINDNSKVSKTGDTMTGNLTAPKFIGAFDEANLTWGGKNFSASYGCIDAALMDELGANRFQFIKASAITVEYSRDGGSTWTDYGATDAQKQQIFAQGGSLIIGKPDSTHKATEHPGEYQLRITIDTGVAGVYTVLNKFVILISTNGSTGCLCKIQKALQSTPTAFIDHTDWTPIGGWSGYNVLNTNGLTTYGNHAPSQNGRVRFVFKDTGASGTSYSGLVVSQIKAFGGVGWICPSTMAKTGHLYAYNENQTAVFPNAVYATAFYENNVALSSKYFALSGGTITGVPKFAAGSISTFSGNVPYILGIEAFADGGDVKWKKSDDVSVGYLIETDYTSTDYARHSAGSRFKTVLTRQNKCGIGTSSAGGLLLASNWTSNSYNAELYMGMGDNLCMYYRGINSNTYTDWYPIGRFTQTTPTTNQVIITDGTTGGIKSSGYTIAKSVPSDAVFTDTKNTAGSTDTSSKLFLIGATSQAANPQTYSQDTAYVGTDGCLYSGGTKVLTAHQDISGKADKSATVSTVTWSNNKLTKTINGTTSDVVSAATILGNLTSSQVTTALGYTPASINTTYDFESSDNSISFMGSAVGSVVTVDMTVEGKVSTEGDTISGDYVNTADFSESGVYGKRVTTYGPWGIDVEEYLADSLWSRLSLRDSDILLTKTWDGTNTSLKSSITSLRNDKVNRSGDTISGDLAFAGGNVYLKTPSSSSDDSGDIAFYYGNGAEKCRIWTSNEYTTAAGPNYRVYKKDGSALYSGRLATMADLSWGNISGKPSYLPTAGGTMTGIVYSSYGSASWVNSLTKSSITLTDGIGFGGWICGPTKNGRIAIATYKDGDDILYFGYGERGRTANSYTRRAYWNGANGLFASSVILGESMLRSSYIGRNDSGDSGYINHVNTGNTAYAPTRASAFTTMSCKYTKTNVVDISEEDALKLLDIRPVNFDYVEEVGGQKNQIGVLAEDTYKILPKVVSVPEDYVEEDFDISKGIHQPLPSVDYAKFVPYLIKMVQIQEREIDSLKKIIEDWR